MTHPLSTAGINHTRGKTNEASAVDPLISKREYAGLPRREKSQMRKNQRGITHSGARAHARAGRQGRWRTF